MAEEWRDIEGYEGLYQVSNLGNVRSLRTKAIMKTNITNWGYCQVCLRAHGERKNKAVHRLVAIAFIPNSESKDEVNHINGIKTDNRADNLEWVTRRENIRHAYKSGLRNAVDEAHGQMKVVAINVITGEIMQYPSQGNAAIRLGINQGSISRSIRTGRSAGGYKFYRL